MGWFRKKIFKNTIAIILLLSMGLSFAPNFSLESLEVDKVQAGPGDSGPFPTEPGDMKVSQQELHPIKGTLNLGRRGAAYLLTVSVNLMAIFLSKDFYEKAFFSDTAKKAIETGWSFVRDFVNMFYLLILIFLSISIILRIPGYNDKKFFVGIIFSALLVNFSMAITWVVIDVSNLAMNFFLDLGIDPMKFMDASAIARIQEGLYSGEELAGDSIAVSMLVEIMVYIIMASMMFWVALSFFIRAVGFWVLLVLSPLAFFSFAIPGKGGNIFNDWSKHLTNYAFYGPIMLFFLVLSAKLLAVLDGGEGVFNVLENITSVEGWARMGGSMISYIATIYFLFYGYNIAKEMGSSASKVIGKAMNKGEAWANKTVGAPLTAAKFGAKGLGEVTGVMPQVDVWKKQLRRTTLGGYFSKDKRKEKMERSRLAIDAKKNSASLYKGSEKEITKWKENGKINDHNFLIGRLNNGDVLEKAAAARAMAKKGILNKDRVLAKSAIKAMRGQVESINTLKKAIEGSAKETKFKTNNDVESLIKTMKEVGSSDEKIKTTLSEVSKTNATAVIEAQIKEAREEVKKLKGKGKGTVEIGDYLEKLRKNNSTVNNLINERAGIGNRATASIINILEKDTTANNKDIHMATYKEMGTSKILEQQDLATNVYAREQIKKTYDAVTNKEKLRDHVITSVGAESRAGKLFKGELK